MTSNPGRSLAKFTHSRRKLLIDLAVLAVAGVGGGLSVLRARAQSAGGVFVGKIDGTNAFVGIVTDEQQAEGYVCDGASFKELFQGTLADASAGQLTLAGEDGDSLTLAIDQNTLPDLFASGGNLAGSLLTQADNALHPFSAEPAMGPGAVYLSIGTLPDGTTTDGGTVVLNNGDLRGILALLGIALAIVGPTLGLAIPTFFIGGGNAGGPPPTSGGTGFLDVPATANSAPLMFTAGVAGGTPQPAPPAMLQAVQTLQSSQALSGANGPQPVSIPVPIGNTTLTTTMVPLTPAKLGQTGPATPSH